MRVSAGGVKTKEVISWLTCDLDERVTKVAVEGSSSMAVAAADRSTSK
jgi:hypothetical protein